MKRHSGAGKHTPHSVGSLLYCLQSAQPITKFKYAAITLFLLLRFDLADRLVSHSFHSKLLIEMDVDRGVLIVLTDDEANFQT